MNHINFKAEQTTLFLISIKRSINYKQKKIATDLYNYIPEEVKNDLDFSKTWGGSYSRVIENDEEVYYYNETELIRHKITYNYIYDSDRKDGLFCNVQFAYFSRLFKLKMTTSLITDNVLEEPYLLLEGTPENKLILVNGTVCVCTSFEDRASMYQKIKDEPLKLYKYTAKKPKSFKPKKIFICFDCETCQRPDSDHHECYLLSAHFELNLPSELLLWDEETESYKPLFEKTTYTLSWKNYNFEKDLGEVFAEYILSELPIINSTNEIVLFGYNNNKFDNNFIIKGFQNKGFSLTINERNGKVTEGSLSRKSLEHNIKIILNDIRKWIPDMTLQQACEDYDVTPKKLDYINIVKFNETITDQVPELADENLLKQTLKTTIDGRELKKLKNEYSSISSPYTTLDDKPMPRIPLKDDKGKPLYRIADLIQYYCEMDCRSTFALFKEIAKSVKELVNDIEETVIYAKLPSDDFMDYMSASNLAGYVLKLYLLHKDQYLLKCQNEQIGQKIHSSYFGGRVNFGCLGEYIGVGPLNYMDVTSEYPLTMTGPMPSLPINGGKKSSTDINEYIEIGENFNTFEIQYLINETRQKIREMLETKQWDWQVFANFDWTIFYAEVDYEPPNQNEPEWLLLSQFAPVPIRIEDAQSIRYSNCAQYGKFINNAQAKNLLLSGFKITIKPNKMNLLFKKSECIFAPLIDMFGKKKSNAKEEGNKTLAKLYKLIQNSFAGKMAQRPIHTISKYVSFNKHDSSKNRSTYEIENWRSSLHYLAAIITSQANWIIYSTIYRLEMNLILQGVPREGRLGILYMDTDSIVYDSGIYPNIEFFIHEETGHYETTEYIIHWSKHYKKEIRKLIILGRKAYILLDNQNKPIDIKLKGIHGEQMANFTTPEQIAKLLNKELVSQNFGGLKKTNIMNEEIQGNQKKEAFQQISNTSIKKSLKMDNYTETLKPANEQVIIANKTNLDNGKLIFTKALDKPTTPFFIDIDDEITEEEQMFLEEL